MARWSKLGPTKDQKHQLHIHVISFLQQFSQFEVVDFQFELDVLSKSFHFSNFSRPSVLQLLKSHLAELRAQLSPELCEAVQQAVQRSLEHSRRNSELERGDFSSMAC